MGRKHIKLRNAMQEMHDELKSIRDNCMPLNQWMLMQYEDAERHLEKVKKLEAEQKQNSKKEEENAIMCPETEDKCDEGCDESEDCEKSDEEVEKEEKDEEKKNDLQKAYDEADHHGLYEALVDKVESVPRTKEARMTLAEDLLNKKE